MPYPYPPTPPKRRFFRKKKKKKKPPQKKKRPCLPRIRSHLYRASGLLSAPEIQDGKWRGIPVTIDPETIATATANNWAIVAYPILKMGRITGLSCPQPARTAPTDTFLLSGVLMKYKGKLAIVVWRNKTDEGKCRRRLRIKEAQYVLPVHWEGMEAPTEPRYTQVECNIGKGIFGVIRVIVEPVNRLPFQGKIE